MSQNSKIEWTNSSWNPTTGCTKISNGCTNCYAERLCKRLKSMGNPNYANGFTLTLHPQMLNLPYSWKKSQMIFVNSMSDLLHEDVPIDFIENVVDVMKGANWHQYQILTKRAERLVEVSKVVHWPDNAWIGVTVENNDFLYRLDLLNQINAKIKFISFEPLIGPVSKADLSKINWVIVGGESGPKARKIEKEWILSIRDMCIDQKVPFFFKQWGGVNKKKNGRILEGKIWNEMP